MNDIAVSDPPMHPRRPAPRPPPLRSVITDIAVFDQPMRQRCLAHGPLSDQNNLGVHVTTCRLGRFHGADAGQVIDVDLATRSSNYEPRISGTEGDGNRI